MRRNPAIEIKDNSMPWCHTPHMISFFLRTNITGSYLIEMDSEVCGETSELCHEIELSAMSGPISPKVKTRQCHVNI